MDGIGQIDGEILETLWWPIDKIAGITRAMSKAHRQEVLDDNMYDSNWKKWVGIGMFPQSILIKVVYQMVSLVASLCRKYQKAEATVETMNSAVKELTKSIGNSSWISEWKKLEKAAKTKRGEALMIYNVSHTPGMFSTPVIFPSPLIEWIAPSQAKKQEDLMKTSKKDRHVQWLLEGLILEAEQ